MCVFIYQANQSTNITEPIYANTLYKTSVEAIADCGCCAFFNFANQPTNMVVAICSTTFD